MDLVCYTRRHAIRLGNSMRALIRDQSGATAVEYGLIATLIVIAIIGAITTVGTHLNAVWATLSNNVNPNLAH